MNAQRNTPVVSILASSRSQEQAPEPDPRDYSLLQAVDASIKAADWLTGADRAAMTLARTYAAAIDSALAEHLAAKRADIGGTGRWCPSWCPGRARTCRKPCTAWG